MLKIVHLPETFATYKHFENFWVIKQLQSINYEKNLIRDLSKILMYQSNAIFIAIVKYIEDLDALRSARLFESCL